MEYRKIIKFGNSSHVISLPNAWLKKNNLNKGDRIFLQENGTNEIVLFTKETEFREAIKEIIIDANNKSLLYVSNALITAYTNNYNLIKILDKNLNKRSNEIRNFIHSLAGLEVIEQSNDRIVAKDFLSIKDIYFDAMVRRTDIIIRNMLKNAKDCIKKDYTVSVANSDFDVNRLAFALIKIARKSFDNPQVAKELKLGYYETLNYYRLMFNLEQMGDEIKRMARLFNLIRLKKEDIKQLILYYEKVESMYQDSMKAFYNKDKELAFSVLEQGKNTTIIINKLLKDYVESIHARIIEKLKNLIDCIEQTSRIAANL